MPIGIMMLMLGLAGRVAGCILYIRNDRKRPTNHGCRQFEES